MGRSVPRLFALNLLWRLRAARSEIRWLNRRLRWAEERIAARDARIAFLEEATGYRSPTSAEVERLIRDVRQTLATEARKEAA